MPSYAPDLTPLALSFALFGGCASMGNPPEDLIKHVPLIEIGKPEPADNNYILYIPGGNWTLDPSGLSRLRLDRPGSTGRDYRHRRQPPELMIQVEAKVEVE